MCHVLVLAGAMRPGGPAPFPKQAFETCAMRSQEQSPSALDIAVVLDFEEQFGWANVQMLAEHEQWEEQMEQKRLRSIRSFL